MISIAIRRRQTMGGKNKLVKTFYQDGIFYFICLSSEFLTHWTARDSRLMTSHSPIDHKYIHLPPRPRERNAAADRTVSQLYPRITLSC